MEADAELHTPQLNKIGLPDGMAEYALRRAIRDLSRLYGRQQAQEIASGVIEDETGIPDARTLLAQVREIMTEWNFGPVPDRYALDAIFRVVGDNIQTERKS